MQKYEELPVVTRLPMIHIELNQFVNESLMIVYLIAYGVTKSPQSKNKCWNYLWYYLQQFFFQIESSPYLLKMKHMMPFSHDALRQI